MSEVTKNIWEDLHNLDPNVRELVLDKIASLNLANALDLILPFIQDPDAGVRGTVACNLGLIHDDRTVPYLIELVEHDPSEEVRIEAIRSLSEYKSSEILNCLVAEVYREKRSRQPRQEAAKQLRHYDSEKAVDALVVLLQDPDVFVRDHAAESLLCLNRYRLRSVWESVMADRSADVQETAIQALAQLND